VVHLAKYLLFIIYLAAKQHCSEKANQKALKRQLCTKLEGSKVIIRMSAANSRVQVSSQAFDKWTITTTKSHIMTKDQTEK
jgi:hypothetical protein